MTTTTKSILALVGAVLLVWAVWGAYQYPKQDQNTVIAGTSTAGSTFNTAKFAGIAVNLASAGANGTSSSILNGDANDRYITVIRAGCEGIGTSLTAYTGAGLASLQLSVATTSTSAPATNSTNTVGGGAITIGTSTSQFAVSTSTLNSTGQTPGTSKVYFIWPSGSYLTFSTNATNTALCTFGADYIAS